METSLPSLIILFVSLPLCSSSPLITNETQNCEDRKGNLIAHGQWYLPDLDPCRRCTCDNGSPVSCRTARCVAPSCDYERIEDECCSFVCDGVTSGWGKNCTDMKGNTAKHGEFYVPGEDACLNCECKHGLPHTCMKGICAAPPCGDYEKLEGECCMFICTDENSTKMKKKGFLMYLYNCKA